MKGQFGAQQLPPALQASFVSGGASRRRSTHKRGEYFGNGTADDNELGHRVYGIVNVGPPLKL